MLNSQAIDLLAQVQPNFACQEVHLRGKAGLLFRLCRAGFLERTGRERYRVVRPTLQKACNDLAVQVPSYREIFANSATLAVLASHCGRGGRALFWRVAGISMGFWQRQYEHLARCGLTLAGSRGEYRLRPLHPAIIALVDEFRRIIADRKPPGAGICIYQAGVEAAWVRPSASENQDADLCDIQAGKAPPSFVYWGPRKLNAVDLLFLQLRAVTQTPWRKDLTHGMDSASFASQIAFRVMLHPDFVEYADHYRSSEFVSAGVGLHCIAEGLASGSLPPGWKKTRKFDLPENSRGRLDMRRGPSQAWRPLSPLTPSGLPVFRKKLN